MAEFSPSDAASEGFRITREHPSVIPLWAVLQFIVSMGATWALVSSGYLQALTDLQAAGGVAPDFTALVPSMMAFFQRFLPILPFMIVFGAMIQTAVLRMVLRPQERSPGYLRLGMDELRVVGVQLIVGLVIGGFSFFGLVLISSVIAVGKVVGALLSFPLLLAYIGGIVFLSVRLSLAVPSAFARGKVDIKAAWDMTQGKFWPLVGVYLLAFVFYMIVAIAGGLIGQVVALAFGGATPPATVKTFQELLTAGQLVGDVITAVIGALGSAILFAPAAVIYRALSGERDAEAF